MTSPSTSPNPRYLLPTHTHTNARTHTYTCARTHSHTHEITPSLLPMFQFSSRWYLRVGKANTYSSSVSFETVLMFRPTEDGLLSSFCVRSSSVPSFYASLLQENGGLMYTLHFVPQAPQHLGFSETQVSHLRAVVACSARPRGHACSS